MKILVTGAKGFVGKNLCLELRARGFEVLEYDLDTTKAELKGFVNQADFIVHLAGINRPLTKEEFYDGNVNFTHELATLIFESGRKTPVIYSSSIQAERDNDYGKSKKMAEDYLREFSHRTGTPIYIYRLANLFGKWSRPNYNSVVATFCHNIAHDLPVQVNDREVEIPFLYIDDVLIEFIRVIEGTIIEPMPDYLHISPTYQVKIGRLADLINSFKQSRVNLVVPDLADDFTRKLYATYLSYLPQDKFAYDLKMNADNRGSFTEFLRTLGAGQVSINVTKPGITKGNHWHHTKNEKFLVVAGQAEINFRLVGASEVITFRVDGEHLQVVDIPTGYTHNITNIGSSDLVTVMWASEPFNPNTPDTYFDKV